MWYVHKIDEVLIMSGLPVFSRSPFLTSPALADADWMTGCCFRKTIS